MGSTSYPEDSYQVKRIFKTSVLQQTSTRNKEHWKLFGMKCVKSIDSSQAMRNNWTSISKKYR